jgi:hypothetical protein
MKIIPFTNFCLRRAGLSPVSELKPETLNLKPSTFNFQPSTRRRERGVALIITLILLSVTLVMAVAFLAISRRERGSVATESDATTAKFAADSALAHAEARMVAQILVTTNPYVQPLLVSTNYYNANGFTNGSADLLNVNYNYVNNNGGPLTTAAQIEQNIANLYFNPRPPVYYSNDFRYYLDLNRNGRYDTNGVVTNVDMALNGLGTTSLQVGDPEWIGVLEHPDQPHGPNNQFIARYCFIAVPADSLDLNEIHNQALNALTGNANVLSPLNNRDAYSRNQGVGAWEINLAAFLADLNPNLWDVQPEPYTYPEIPLNSSFAFDDARSLIAWRYSSNYFSLQSANNVFGNAGASLWLNNGVDGYSVYAQTNFATNFAGNYGGSVSGSSPWLGSPNTYDYFYSPSELFDPTKSSGQFVNRIYNVGTSNDTYDRYTFYRMLGQISSDSAPESDKININYSNAVVNCDANGVLLNLTVIPNLETNFFSWQPQIFFTAAADKMLHTYSAEWYESSPSNYINTYYGISRPLSLFPWTYFTNMDGMQVTNIAYAGQTNQIPAFGITNIPVYVNSTFAYTPAINRVLQLAANIYDASTWTNDPLNGISNYPSVFRPVFWTTNEFNAALGRSSVNTYIKGYQYIPVATNGVGDSIFAAPIEVTALRLGISVSNVWGVPWIIGAKKGFPNLDKVEMENNFFIERLLQFNRQNDNPYPQSTPFSTISNGRKYSTNQMYIMGVSNYFGIAEANNYAENYNNGVAIVARDTVSMGLTWTNDPIIGGGGSSVVNTYYGSETNVQMPFQAGASVMLLGRNLFNYSLTAGSYTLNSMNTFVSLPFVLNDANVYWTTNSSFVFYYGPGSKTFTGNNGGTFNAPDFIPTFLDPSNFLDIGTPPLPQMTMFMTNRLQAFMVDSKGKILDYVQLGGMDGNVNVNQNIADPDSSGLWSTNGFQGGDYMPYGVWDQYSVSAIGGNVPAGDQDGKWANTPVPGTANTGQAAQQAFFSAFFSPNNEAPYIGISSGYVTNEQLSIQAPYTPIRVSTQKFIYEANDPLVHYISSDLNDPSASTNTLTTDNPVLSKLTSANDRYAPWGTNGPSWPGSVYYDSNPYNLAYKDPLVASPDNWDFPTNKFPSVGWLGRVHRGTPWQSVYLKSTNLLSLVRAIPGSATYLQGINTWQLWTGNQNGYDATNMEPVQDRLLFDLFTATPNDDATRGQLSVNVGADDPNNLFADLAAWSSVLSGINVFSNNLPNQTVGRSTLYQNPLPGQTGPNYINLTLQPAGFNLNSAMGQIVASINSIRASRTNIDGLTNVFEHVGDVLAAPQLADQSPLLNATNFSFGGARSQIQNGISDEMYEWVPQQMMGLLTVNGTPQAPQRYVVYCYGQTLKPAPNSIVTSGTFFGLVTNYQVTAESGTRAIIRVENTPTPANPAATPHIVVEQYNPLPPD